MADPTAAGIFYILVATRPGRPALPRDGPRHKEHYVDTEGYTDRVFAMCCLLGFRFAPRIRDPKARRIFTVDEPSRYGDLAP